MKTRQNLADRLAEPDDGTCLVIRDSSGELHLICRNDQDAADSLEEPGDERWFSSEWSYPEYETWASILTYAVAVYRVGDKPIASFDSAAELAAADERAEVDRLRAEPIHFWPVTKIPHDETTSVGPWITRTGWIGRSAGTSDPAHTRTYAAQLLAAADEAERRAVATSSDPQPADGPALDAVCKCPPECCTHQS